MCMSEKIKITIDKEIYYGKVWEDNDGLWLIEIPKLDIMTQGKDKDDAIEMMKDAIEFIVKD